MKEEITEREKHLIKLLRELTNHYLNHCDYPSQRVVDNVYNEIRKIENPSSS